MTLSGIITMVLSIGAVWTLFIVCCARLIRKDRKEETNGQK